MQFTDSRKNARAAARAYEAGLPTAQRKTLGQFFTGIQLGRLLAHLALDPSTTTVLDPMAGHGDLLDAAWEAAEEQSLRIRRLDGIEIDSQTATVCRNRLSSIIGRDDNRVILSGSAFDIDVVNRLDQGGYDLVITNPPYVRYQVRRRGGLGDDKIRSALTDIANAHVDTTLYEVWKQIIGAYSGLSDLSIPSWLLAALLVKPGGRLALVVPATWRSRDYAYLIRYMLLRCFTLEYVVEDTQPGWFSEALVRTHLIVARRLPVQETLKPLRERNLFASAQWIQIAPSAADRDSLVGNVLPGANPEGSFAYWLRQGVEGSLLGIQRRQFALRDEWEFLETQVGLSKWYMQLEGTASDLRLFAPRQSKPPVSLPDVVRDIGIDNAEAVRNLEDCGVSVGQGLRTGCNQFFYVTMSNVEDNDFIRVTATPTFDCEEFVVPQNALQTVLRNQSEIPNLVRSDGLPGRVLDLREWVLPEDAETVGMHLSAYYLSREPVPQTMSGDLVTYTRRAVRMVPQGTNATICIPDLSAVRTNVRVPRNTRTTPRFWYMLPDFTSRHRPAAFVARVNYKQPWVEANLDPPILIDANFCTFWSTSGLWTRFALKALLNSVWCRTVMEALGTTLGGGALKLEASHLRRMPVPHLSREAIELLDRAGKRLTLESWDIQQYVDDIVVRGLFSQVREDQLKTVVATLEDRVDRLNVERQRRRG